MPPFVIARLVQSETREVDEAIPRSNPKLKALNSKQILISKFKTQNPLGHLDFGHLILFSISDFGFRILFFGIDYYIDVNALPWQNGGSPPNQGHKVYHSSE